MSKWIFPMPQIEASSYNTAQPAPTRRAALWRKMARFPAMKRGNDPMARARIAALVWLMCTLFGVPNFATAEEQAALTVRLTQSGDINRIELGMTFRPGFKISTLISPNRIIVDFPEIDWRLTAPVPGRSIRYVDRMRFGLVRPGASRMVIDLRAPARVAKAYTEETRADLPPRFVIELVGESEEAFLARAQVQAIAAGKSNGANLWPPAPMRRPKRGIVIAIDPGHGGIDPGASYNDVSEKELVLSYANEIAAALSQTPGVRAVLTRTEDVFLTLRQRVEIARRAEADAFISLHADALERGDARGATVFTLSREASDEEAAELASGNNRADVIGGVRFDEEADDVALVLVDFARRATDAASREMAEELVRQLETTSETLKGRGLQSAGFRVLKAPDMPSALIELGFLSSARDRARLLSPDGRADLVEAIRVGILRWAAGQPGEQFDKVRAALPN